MSFFQEFRTETKLLLVVALAAIILTVGGVLLLKTMQPLPSTMPVAQVPQPTPILIWYHPTVLSPQITGKSGLGFFVEPDFTGIDASYWCAIDLAGLGGGFHIRQRSLRGNPYALLKGAMDYIDRQQEGGDLAIREEINIGSFPALYVKSKHDGVQWAQSLLWETDDTFVRLAVDSWCKSDNGDELTKEEIIKIADSMLQNPIPIFEPSYLPPQVFKESVEWLESRPIEEEDLGLGQLKLKFPEMKVTWNYACRPQPKWGVFSISQELLNKDNENLAQLADNIQAENNIPDDLVTREEVSISGGNGLYMEYTGTTLPSQRLFWTSGSLLLTITSSEIRKDSCAISQEDIMKTAKSFVPLLDIYFVNPEKTPPIQGEKTEESDTSQKEQKASKEGLNPGTWPLYTGISDGIRYQINVPPDLKTLYGPNTEWSTGSVYSRTWARFSFSRTTPINFSISTKRFFPASYTMPKSTSS